MSNNNSKPSIGKRGGEFIILAIYLFGDTYEFWNVNHLLCLSLAGLGIFALIWYDDALDPRQLGILAALLVTLAVVVDWVAPPGPPPNPWRGWLQPANDPTPENGCTNPSPDMPRWRDTLPSETPVLILGHYGMRVSTSRRFSAISIGNCQSLAFERSPDGIKVSAQLYDANGDRLGDIVDNGYDIENSPALVVEHTGDLSTLVVHDADREELLYVQFVNSRAIKVRGSFYCPSAPHASVIVTQSRLTTGGVTMNSGCITNSGAGLCVACGR